MISLTFEINNSFFSLLRFSCFEIASLMGFLAEKYNPNGYFPFVVVLDKSGNVLGKIGYKKTTPQEYIKIIDSY